ncbi:hypothetical protein BV898_17885 [Hypsibius exemplaris]|uniref:Spaetzle domain-containing protein n=1 Tax=Hypsibius exemplaris TaxID=2072580 RepID=A0A9X6NG51_HYPEX|nr:hypothetical protein BV898_17885 [Hypsibius exemplaris]
MFFGPFPTVPILLLMTAFPTSPGDSGMRVPRQLSAGRKETCPINGIEDLQRIFEKLWDNSVMFWKVPDSSSSRRKRQLQAQRPADYCGFAANYTETGPNYAPKFIRNGSCTDVSCMHGLYDCKPQLKTIKLLYIDPYTCERSFDAKLVVIGCLCQGASA